MNCVIKTFFEDFTKPSDSRVVEVLNCPILELSDSFSKPSDSVSNNILNAPIVELTEGFQKPSDSIENTVIGTAIKELSESFKKPSDNIENLVYAPPKILSYNPTDDSTTYSFYSTFSVTVQSDTSVQVIFELYDDTPDSEGGKQLIKSWGWLIATQVGSSEWYAEYKIEEELDGYLLPGFYNLKIRVKNEAPEGYNYTEKWVKFSISKGNIEIRFENLEYLIDKNSLRFTFKVKHPNEIWVSLYHLLLNRYMNKPFEITKVEYDEPYYLRDNNTLLMRTTKDFKYLKIDVKYKVKGELVDVANKLKKSEVSIGLKVLITDVISEKTYDLSRYLIDISFSQSMELSSTQCSINFVTNNGLSPFTNVDTPLFYGNKVKIYSYLEGEEYLEWQGYITEIQTSKERISITAFDKLVNFNKKLEKDLIYSPETHVVKERLKSLDGVRFKASYDSWVTSFRPKVWVAGELLKAEEYTVDYYRGEVYIMKNPYLHPSYFSQVYPAEDMEDRKKINLGFDINLSSAQKVYKIWKEATNYTCVEGVEETIVWVEKTQELFEDSDYIIDYGDNTLILKESLPENTDTAKDYAIRIECRSDIGEVTAEYKYYIPNTNEVESIIKDLSKQVGFVDSELESSETERVYSRNNFHFQLSHKSIKSINWIKIDDEVYNGDYNLIEKEGMLELDVPSIETIIDPINSLFKITGSEDVSFSLVDGVVGKCIKAELTYDNSYVGKDYHYYNIYLDLSSFKEVAFMIKPDKDLDHVTLELVDCNWNSFTFQSINSLEEGKWNEVIFNISSLETRNCINQVHLWFPKAGTVLIDYFHTPSHKVEVSYNYETIEFTGISASESHYLKEEVETYKDVLTDVMKLLPPSYRLWVDKNEKLYGRDLKLPFYYILPLTYSMHGLESDNIYGKFLIPDYALTLMSSFQHHISTDQIFNAVEVIGKKSYLEDAALAGSVEDKCSVVEGKVYGENMSATFKKTIPFPFFKSVIPNFFYDVEISKEKALIDGDINTGIYWYKTKRNDVNPPFSKDELLAKIILKEPIYWTEIVVSVGTYMGKVIRSEFYVECETEDGEKFYPEDVVPNRKQAQSGSHLKFTNKRFPYKKIKYVYIYGSAPFYWFTSEQQGGKK